MKNDEARLVCTIIPIFAFGALIGFIIGSALLDSKMRKQAIERGHALHDPATGEWRWKEEGE